MDEVDVVVAGSGAAGMTAALTAAHLGLSALVIEKAGSFGGSTARSGGGIWAPGNSVLRAAGVADTPEPTGTTSPTGTMRLTGTTPPTVRTPATPGTGTATDTTRASARSGC